MLIKHGLTAICLMAGLALLAPGALADHHHQPGAAMRDQGIVRHDGVVKPGRMMDRKTMRRHMTSEMRSKKRSKRRRHHRDRRFGDRVRPISHLTVEDVRHHFEHRLKRRGNDRLKIGAVTKIDDDTITAAIVTVDNSLVRRLRVDRHSGRVKPE